MSEHADALASEPQDAFEPGRRPVVYVPPGQIAVSDHPRVFATVLGSCVAVCLHDPACAIGGMNHYLLPNSGQAQESAKFGTIAIPRLIERLLAMGCNQQRLVAKVFGGACVLGAYGGRGVHLGAQNVRLAYELLWAEKIPVVAEDVDGIRGRKVLFCTDSGAIWLRRL